MLDLSEVTLPELGRISREAIKAVMAGVVAANIVTYSGEGLREAGHLWGQILLLVVLYFGLEMFLGPPDTSS